ncbi:hypothetical protein ACHAPT_007307 [Fusarium lateritium]
MNKDPVKSVPGDAGLGDDIATINEGITRARIERFQKTTRPRTEELLKEKGFNVKDYNFDDLPDAPHQEREDRFIKCINSLLDLALGSDTAPQEITSAVSAKDDEPHASEESLYSTVPLDISASSESLRLLELFPATSPDAPICAKLLCPDNSEKHEYEALSYVWGSPEPVCPITVNDHQTMINFNLHDALKYLRRQETSRILWVDQLCINQQNLAEKSHQVTRMGDIYRKATDVLIFLGPPTAPLTFFMDALGNKRLIDLQDEGVEEPGSILHLAMEAVRAFCSTPWWTRLWALQEFYLAKGDPLWYCGDLSARTSQIQDELVRLLKDVFSHRVELEERDTSDLSLQHVKAPLANLFPRVLDELIRRSESRGPRRPKDNEKGTYQPKTRLHLLPSVLYAHLDRSAADPSDYVYGVRDLMGPVFSQTLIPDYSTSVGKTFERLAAWLLLVESWADMFWHYPYRRAVSPDGHVSPSWVPDFSRRPQKPHFEPAPGGTGPERDPKHINCAIVDRVLHVQGRELGTIKDIVPLSDDNSLALINQLWRFDNQHSHHPTGLARVGITPKIPSPSFYWALDQLMGVYQTMSTRASLNFQLDVAVLFKILDQEFDQVRRDLETHVDVDETCSTDYESDADSFHRNRRLLNLYSFLTGPGLSEFAGSCMFDYTNLVSRLQALVFQTEQVAHRLFGLAEEDDEERTTEPFYVALARQLYTEGAYEEEIQAAVVRILRVARVFHEVCQHRWSGLKFEPKIMGGEQPAGLDAQVEELSKMALDKLRSLDHVLPNPMEEVSPLQILLDSREVIHTGRVIFQTSNDQTGLSCPGVEGVAAGQRVVLLDGPGFPMIICPTPSPSSDKHRYGKVVGHAMVEGANGELGGSPKTKPKMYRIV